MIHVGDITKLNGAKLEPVWCITGGSPCQDLSIAGKGKGLAGKRSGLYMEQIRVVKEMREHDKGNGRTGELVRPRYMVWENVPGAFSSNGGADFQTVLEELVRIVEPDVVIPRPENGKWQKAGFIIGDGWSVAWRTHDAQYWGVPQRRRRICLVADFNGYTAGDVVFERVRETERPGDNETVTGLRGEPRPQILPFGESLSRDFEPRRTAQQEALRNAGTGAVPTVARSLTARYDGSPCADRGPNIIVCALEQSPTLNSECGGNKPAVVKVFAFDAVASNSMKSSNPNSGCREVDCARTLDTTTPDPSKNQGGNCVLDMTHACDVIRECGQIVPSLQARMGTGGNQVPLTYAFQAFGVYKDTSTSSTCKQRDYKEATDLVCRAVDCRNGTESEVNGTLQAKESGSSLNLNNVVRESLFVRRLTPLECTRLQGFPDNWVNLGDWTDSKGKRHKEADAPKYKALGNSIALPYWRWMTRRMARYLPEHATLGSLFDGIGGFPLVWQETHGDYTARWASEIEEFPMAVTKLRFPEPETMLEGSV